MDLDEFRKDFIETVRVHSAADENFEHASFVEHAANILVESEEMDNFEPCYFRGSGPRKKALWVDGYAFDDVDGSCRLMVAEWEGEDVAGKLSQSEAAAILGKLRGFIEESLKGGLMGLIEESSPAYGLADELLRKKRQTTRYQLYLVTDSLLGSRAADWPEDSLSGIPVQCHVWDMARFSRISESATGRDELVVDLTKYTPNGLPVLPACEGNGDVASYLCVVSGRLLADIYDIHGSRLLEGNVRSYLSTKGKVNKGIRNTILQTPEMFFPYNNGISATATEVDTSEKNGHLYLLSIKDFQIVNGAQTTASLSEAKRNDKTDLNGVFVQMKLSVISPERSGKIVPLISRYANTQNKVSDADFFSNHEFHIRIETLSRKVWAPALPGTQHETHWFYERTRGQFLNAQSRLKPSERKSFLKQTPKEQLVTKTNLAKYENSWGQKPHVVSSGAQKNFISFANEISARWERDREVFNEEYFRRAVAKAILFRKTEKIVSGQTWYQGGYRANIVTYTIAKLASMLDDAFGSELKFNFREIWQKQDVSNPLLKQLALVAERVFTVIVAPDTQFQNITEWCKKEVCWSRVRAEQIDFFPDFLKTLIHKDDDRADRKEAKTFQKMDSGIAIQSEVVQLGSDYWRQLKEWATRSSFLTDQEIQLLGLAERMPKVLPTEKQCAKLTDIRQRMILEGFSGNSSEDGD